MRRIVNPFSVAVLFALLSVRISFGATINWTNTAGGDWNVAANWDPNQTPGPTDTAQITNPGTYAVTNSGVASANILTLGGATGTQTLVLSGGSLTLGTPSTGSAQGVFNMSGGTLGGAPLVLAGPLNWSGGTITNVVQFNGGTFSGNLSLISGKAVNTGLLNWTSASMTNGNNSIISNTPTGIINLTANLVEGSSGGFHTFNNAGQLFVTTSDTANLSDTFNNTGSVTVNGGTLDFSGGGTGNGSFAAVAGTTLEFDGGTFTINSGATISGDGNFTMNGGKITVAPALNLGGAWTFQGGSIATLSSTAVSGNAVTINRAAVFFNGPGPWQPGTLLVSNSSSFLGGTAPVTVQDPGGFTWAGGMITNQVQVDGGSITDFGASLVSGTLINTGVLNWNTAQFSGGSGSLVSNAPSGTINLVQPSIGEAGAFFNMFNNAGQFNVTGFSVVATIGNSFNNTGTVIINSGVLQLQGGGTESGSFTIASGATNAFNGGTFTVTDGASFSGSGTWLNAGSVINFTGTSTLNTAIVNISGGTVLFNNSGSLNPALLNLSGGTLAGTNPVIVSGPLNWSGGTISNKLVQFAGGAFSGSSTLFLLNGGKVVNTGLLNWTSASMTNGNNSIISNAPAGIINLTANLVEASLGGSSTFNNAGQLFVTTSGTAKISDTFNNSGSITVNGGTLDFAGGGTGNGSFVAVAGTTLEFGGISTFTINSGATISGDGNFTAEGFITVNTALNLGGTWTFHQGAATLSSTAVSGNAVTISETPVLFNGTGPWRPGTLLVSNGTLTSLGGTAPITVQNPGGFTWVGGVITNVVQFDGGNIGGSAVTLTSGGELINTGVLNWTTGQFNGGPGSIVSNAPTGTINLIYDNGSPSMFNNAGLLNLTASGFWAQTFHNTGTVTINSSILYLTGAHNLAGGTLVFGISALNNYGSSIIAGPADLAGTLESVFNGGYLPSVGNTYNIMTYGSSSGNFTATNLSPLAVWQVNQGATNLSITVLKLVPQLNWPAPADIVYGTALTNANATWNGTNVPGVFTFTPTVPQSGSNQTLSVIFVPTDPSTFASVTNTALVTVQKAPLTVTANNQSKAYGQTITFAGTEFNTVGLVNGDIVTSATLASTGAPSTATVAGSPYPIIISNALGNAGLTNYVITYVNGQLTVTPALLTITANNTNKIVGEALTFGGAEFTAAGLQNSETVGSVTLTSAGATAAAAVGSYPIVPGAPTGGTFSPANYTDNFVNGTLNVLSPPSLAIAIDGTQYVLTFQAMPGQHYQLQTETDLTTSAWTSLGDPISNINGTVYVIDAIAVPQAFFRLQIQLAP